MPQRRVPGGRVQAEEGKIADILLPASSAANERDMPFRIFMRSKVQPEAA